MDGEPVNGIHLFMPYKGKEYVKSKTCGKCKESFFFFFDGQGETEREKWSAEEG